MRYPSAARPLLAMATTAVTLAGLVAATPASARGSAASTPSVNAAAASAAAGTFAAVTPARVLDTRSGTGVPKGAVPARGIRSVAVLGQAGVPASDVSAVVMNVTALHSTMGGYVVAWASGTSRPTATTVSFQPGKATGGLAIVPVGADGKISVYNGSNGTVDIVGDLSGYYVSGTPSVAGAFGSLTPFRAMDTRSGTGVTKGAVPARAVRSLSVLGQHGVPASGVSAVVVNVTALHSTTGGYVTTWASGTNRPTATTVSFQTGTASGELAVVPVGSDGKISFYNGSNGTVDIVGDLSGYFLSGTPAAAGSYRPVVASRVMDTRTGAGVTKGAVPARGVRPLSVLGKSGVPASGVSAVVVNVTALHSTKGGYVTAWAAGASRPTATTVSFQPGIATGELAVVPVALNGTISFYNGSDGTVDIVADIAGYVLDPPALDWAAPDLVLNRTGQLRSVSCPSTTFCMALDSNGNVLNFDGTTWSAPVKIDTYGGATAVSCASPTFCTAVDGSGHATTYDGRGWDSPTVVDSVPSRYPGLDDVSCAAPDFCVAIDSSGRLSRRHGSGAWTTTQAPVDVAIYHVSCTSPTFCMVTTNEGTALVFNGTNWSATSITLPSGPSLSCASATFCLALQYDGRIATYDGQRWTTRGTIDAPNSADHPGTGYSPVSCAPGTRTCVAAQNGWGVTIADGVRTSRVELDSGAWDLSCPATQFCNAVGGAGTLTYRDGVWQTQQDVDPQGGGIDTLTCGGAAQCVTSNVDGQAAAFDGRSWTRLGPSNGVPAGLRAVSCPSSNACVGTSADRRTYVYDGTTWSESAATDYDITRLSCVSSTFCVGFGWVETEPYGASASIFDGHEWTRSADFQYQPTSFSCVSTTFCMAVMYGGVAIFDGSTWTTTHAIDGDGVNSLACVSARFCVAVASAGFVMTYRDGVWSPPVSLDLGPLYEVSCADETFCVAIVGPTSTTPGGVIEYDGQRWSQPRRISNAALAAVSCPTTALCLVGDTQGQVFAGVRS